MPTLTRRRDPNAGQEAWLVYYGDVCAGGIAVRTATRTALIRGAGHPFDRITRRWHSRAHRSAADR